MDCSPLNIVQLFILPFSGTGNVPYPIVLCKIDFSSLRVYDELYYIKHPLTEIYVSSYTKQLFKFGQIITLT